jgi:hypothetical protein
MRCDWRRKWDMESKVWHLAKLESMRTLRVTALPATALPHSTRDSNRFTAIADLHDSEKGKVNMGLKQAHNQSKLKP